MCQRCVSVFLERFWEWAGRVPLRVKIIGIVICALAAAGCSAFIWYQIRFNKIQPTITPAIMLTELAIIAGTSIVAGSFVAWLLTAILTRPVRDATRVARRVHEGDLSQRVPVWANDELGELARSFNGMIDRLVRSQQTLEATNVRLGARNEELSLLWEELKERDATRARLLAQAVRAQEQERERISRELHDETGQALTALLVQLKVLERQRDPEALAAQASELREIVVGTLDEVRRLARDLRPATLDDLGLVPTLEAHVKMFRRKTSLNVVFAADVLEDFRLPRDTELALYRVAQEALTNVARHAAATEVSVRLEQVGDLLSLSVVDNGRGFDPASALRTAESGVGLLGIRERVELIGGVLTLQSAAGQGTRLRVDVSTTLEAKAEAEVV
ncbi:MAG: sensor histidine kinase [Anaerolineae bacterium]|nr:sensor histidine kinase [Anaerolineae bacterium]